MMLLCLEGSIRWYYNLTFFLRVQTATIRYIVILITFRGSIVGYLELTHWINTLYNF